MSKGQRRKVTPKLNLKGEAERREEWRRGGGSHAAEREGSAGAWTVGS